MLTMQKTKTERTWFNFGIPAELNTEWRKFVSDKYGGYYRGAFTKEIELALRHYIDEYKEDRE